MDKQSAIIDTCVILRDTNVIVRANQIGYPIITDVILGELDGLKKNPDVANDAKQFFRNMSVESENLYETPDRIKILDGDRLTKFTYKNQFIFILHRDKYKSQGNNDSKIREVARDYGFQFVTADRGNKIAAEAEGISSHFWNQTESTQRPDSGTSKPKKTLRKIDSFRLATKVRTLDDQPTIVSALPGEEDKAYLSNRKTSVTLTKKLASGGEGIVFETNRKNSVAKIYHKTHLTKIRRDKLELMISKPVKHPSICWPTDILVNSSGEFCGYLMPKAQGVILQTSVFIPPLLKRKFPLWTRKNLVEIALQFTKAVEFLNERNVLIGDINPMNILVTDEGSKIYIVDCDSFQIEDFPCPVGTINFTSADIQGTDYKSFLRTKSHEEFALATMIFMILMPGKPPYSQEGGISQAENIKSGEFPYPFGKEYRSQNIASGSWRFIWSHFPYAIKEAFHEAFRQKRQLSPSKWLSLLSTYKNELEKGWHSDDIFPTGMKIPPKYSVTRTCDTDGCNNIFEVHKDFEAKAIEAGKGLYCESCLRKFTLERLAHEANVNPAARSQATKNSSFKINKTKNQQSVRKGIYKKASTQNKPAKDGSAIVGILFLGGCLWLIFKIGWYVLPIAIAVYLLVKFGKDNK